MVKDENFITIQGWMVNELNLKGNDLLVYAVIYGFSQTDGQHFTGSRQYLAEWTGTTKRNVQNNLNNLIEKGLIEKHEKYVNNVKFCEYSISPVVKKFHWGGEKISLGGGEKISPNNIDVENIEDNIDSYKENKQKKESFQSAINSYTEDETLRESLTGYVEMRKKMKGFTIRALKLNLNKLDELAFDDYTKSYIVNQSIEHGWKSFYPMQSNRKDDLPF